MGLRSWVLDKWHSVTKLKRDWPKLTLREKWQFFYDIGNTSAHLVGQTYMDDAKIQWFSYIIIIVILMYFALCLHTIVFCTLNGRFTDGLSCLSISGVYISVRKSINSIQIRFVQIKIIISSQAGSGLLTMLTEKRFEAREIGLFGGRFIYNNNLAPTEYNKICSNILRQMYSRFFWILSLRLASVLVAIANPIYIFYNDGVFYTLTDVMIPFVEKNSNAEIYINVIYQMITAYFAGIGFILIENYSALVYSSYNVTTDISLSNMNDISKHLEKNDFKKTEIHMRLRRLFDQIQTTDR